MANTYDWDPPPYPPRKAILALMELSSNAPQEEYLAAWENQVMPLKGKSSSQLFAEKVEHIMANEQREYSDAWSLAKLRHKSLWKAANSKT